MAEVLKHPFFTGAGAGGHDGTEIQELRTFLAAQFKQQRATLERIEDNTEELREGPCLDTRMPKTMFAASGAARPRVAGSGGHEIAATGVGCGRVRPDAWEAD